MGTLYLVATPIGNLDDITLRALRVLREVDLIAAEDTRHSGRLLKHYGIDTRMVSYHEHSPPSRLDDILAVLAEGDVAVITDAGMPGISDPGYELVRAAAERGFGVEPVPGASALTAAVAASGLVPDGFIYFGFLPRRQRERRALLAALAPVALPLILYEAPHRLVATLSDIMAELGDRPLTICRELTKLHEEISRTSVEEALRTYQTRAPRGEFVLVVGTAIAPPPEPVAECDAEAMLHERIQAGMAASAAAREVAQVTGLARSDLYRLALALKQRDVRPPADDTSS